MNDRYNKIFQSLSREDILNSIKSYKSKIGVTDEIYSSSPFSFLSEEATNGLIEEVQKTYFLLYQNNLSIQQMQSDWESAYNANRPSGSSIGLSEQLSLETQDAVNEFNKNKAKAEGQSTKFLADLIDKFDKEGKDGWAVFFSCLPQLAQLFGNVVSPQVFMNGLQMHYSRKDKDFENRMRWLQATGEYSTGNNFNPFMQ